jgi:8-oxo-dGTP diphosphatase
MERNTIIPASYGIFTQEGKILLVKRVNSGYFDGYYSLPAGHVEAHETPIMALQREMEEELGIVIEEDDVTLATTSYRVIFDKQDRVDFFFFISKFEGEMVNNELEKNEELLWVSLEELPENTIPYVVDVLRAIEGRESFVTVIE